MQDKSFFDQIGLGELDDIQKEELLEQLTELTEVRVAEALGEVLTDEQLERFDKLADDEDEEAALTYVRGIYPEYNQMIAEQVELVQQDFIRDMSKLIEHFKQEAPESQEASDAPESTESQ